MTTGELILAVAGLLILLGIYGALSAISTSLLRIAHCQEYVAVWYSVESVEAERTRGGA